MKQHFIIAPNWRHSLIASSYVFGKRRDEVKPVEWPDWISEHLMTPPYLYDSCWCPGCEHRVRKSPFEGVPLTLLDPTPPVSLTATSSCGDVLLVHQRFADAIDSEGLCEEICFGPVQLNDGSISNDWHSAVFRVRKILRGTKNTIFRICPCCGRVVYFATGRRFICPDKNDASIMAGYKLIVDGSVLTNQLRDWIAEEKGLSVYGIKTTQTPLDGFAANLPWYADENPSLFRPYLADQYTKALMVSDSRDRWLDLAIAHSEMKISGNDINSVLPFLEERLSPVQKERLEDFLSLDEKKKSVLPLYESRGFTVDHIQH